MLPDIVNTILLYRRPTIGVSFDVALSSAATTREFFTPGLYILHNLGPNIAYIRMFASDTQNATLSDMPLFPYGSGDMSSIMVQIGVRDVKQLDFGHGHPPDMRYLSGICVTDETATIRATRLTKN